MVQGIIPSCANSQIEVNENKPLHSTWFLNGARTVVSLKATSVSNVCLTLPAWVPLVELRRNGYRERNMGHISVVHNSISRGSYSLQRTYNQRGGHTVPFQCSDTKKHQHLYGMMQYGTWKKSGSSAYTKGKYHPHPRHSHFPISFFVGSLIENHAENVIQRSWKLWNLQFPQSVPGWTVSPELCTEILVGNWNGLNSTSSLFTVQI